MLLLSLLTFLSVSPATAQTLSPWQNQIMTQIENFYRPTALAAGLKFSVVEDRLGTSAVASADNNGVEATVVLQSPFLQAPRLTPDALRLTICHELGHIFGGSPRRHAPVDWRGAVAPDGFSLLSAEAQADYYASMICFPRLVRGEDHAAELREHPPEEAARKICDDTWKAGSEESLICQRSLTGARDFLNMLKDFGVSVATPDTSVATTLDRDTYPFRQCRLDTFVAGAICRDTSGMSLRLDPDDSVQSACRDKAGQRPVCWYPPANL